MNVIRQHWEFDESTPKGHQILRKIERAARTCYKSEHSIANFLHTKKFLRKLLYGEGGKDPHESPFEHEVVTVRIVTNRGVTHEIVRHRIAAYSQESTRYCNYSKSKFGNQCTFILPVWFYDVVGKSSDWEPEKGSLDDQRRDQFSVWRHAMQVAEQSYFDLIRLGQAPEQARDVLPNALKTEIVVTYNMREWRHFFKMRCAKKAHPQMRELALSMLRSFHERIPILFDDHFERFLGGK